MKQLIIPSLVGLLTATAPVQEQGSWSDTILQRLELGTTPQFDEFSNQELDSAVSNLQERYGSAVAQYEDAVQRTDAAARALEECEPRITNAREELGDLTTWFLDERRYSMIDQSPCDAQELTRFFQARVTEDYAQAAQVVFEQELLGILAEQGYRKAAEITRENAQAIDQLFDLTVPLREDDLQRFERIGQLIATANQDRRMADEIKFSVYAQCTAIRGYLVIDPQESQRMDPQMLSSCEAVLRNSQ